MAAQARGTDPGRIDGIEKAPFERCDTSVGVLGIQWHQQRLLGELGDGVEGTPTPTPITSGGHAPVAFASTARTTASMTPSSPADGSSITSDDALSEPPPLSITWTVAPLRDAS